MPDSSSPRFVRVWSTSGFRMLEPWITVPRPHLAAAYLAGNPADGLTPALETRLRERGFSLVQAAVGPAKTLAYTLDRLDETGWYVQARLSDGYSFSRVYDQSGQGLAPAGGLAQTRR